MKQGKVHIFQFENGKFIPSTHRLVRKLSEKIKILVNIVKSPEKISSPQSSLLIDHFSVWLVGWVGDWMKILHYGCLYSDIIPPTVDAYSFLFGPQWR